MNVGTKMFIFAKTKFMLIIEMNKKDNKGRIKIDMDKVVDYYTDPESKNQATKIEFYDGTSVIVADTVEQIEILKKWKSEKDENK